MISRLFTPFIDPAGDALHAQRVRVVVLCCVVILIMASRGTFNHVMSGALWLAAGYALFALLNVGILVKLHRDKDLDQAALAALLLTYASTAMATAMTGGLRMTNVTPYFALIVGSVLLLGRRGLPWVVLAIAIPMGFEAAAALGVVFPDAVPPEARRQDALVTWVAMAVVCALFTLAYEEARAQATTSMEEASRVKSRFLANISHELRTPLQVLTATHELMGRDVSPAKRAALLHTAQRHSAVLAQLVDDLLDLATVQRGHFDLKDEIVDVRALVADLETTVQPLCAPVGLELVMVVEGGVPRWVRGDPNRLRQVLWNLLQNATKFTDTGEVRLQVSAPTGRLAFTVSDTGPGIPSAEHDLIFGDFYQVDDSPTRSTQGAGLGLAIASEIVDRMGGELAVDSELGVGSTFRFAIPSRPASPPLAAPRSAESEASGAVKVLLVEDNDDAREVVRSLLGVLGFEVLEASNGLEAVEQWRASSPDLVLMDVQMPRVDGCEATRRIRRLEAQRSLTPTPIVAMTGHCTQEDRDACTASGMGGFLQKPFRLAALQEAVDAALS